MAVASIRLTASASSYTAVMKQANAQMRQLQQEYSLAAQKAKLMGQSHQEVGARVQMLTEKIKAQEEKISANSKRVAELTAEDKKLWQQHSELQNKLNQTKTAYDKSAEATGKNSKETKALQKEVKAAEKALAENESKLQSNADKLTKAKNQGTLFSKELENMKLKLKAANKELDSDKLKEYGDKMKTAGDKVSAAGQKMLGITAAVTGVGVASVKTASDFDSEMSRVKVIAGATDDEFEKLRKQAIQLGADTVFSASESAAGMENFATAGYNAKEIMAGIPGVLNLAAVSGGDVANAAEVMATIMRSFNLDASASVHVADAFAKAAADTNAEVADMGEAMKYAAPIASSLGISLEETAAAIGIMSDQGIKGSQAGTSLRGALSRLAAPTKAMSAKMKELGVDFFDAKGNMVPLSEQVAQLQSKFKGMTQEQKENAIVTLYGKNALSGMQALIDRGSGALTKMTNSFKNADGAAQDMADNMLDNLAGDVENMSGAFESAGINLASQFTPEIRSITQAVTNAIDKFNGLSDSQQKTIAVIALVVASIGPLLLGVGKIIGTVGSAISGISKIKEAVSGLGLVSKISSGAGKIGKAITGVFSTLGLKGVIIAAVVAAVVAGIVLIIKNWDKIKPALENVWNKAKAIFQTAWNWIKNIFTTLWNFVKTVWNGIKNGIQVAIMFIANLFSAAFNIITLPFRFIWENCKQYVFAAFNAIKTVISSALQVIRTIISTVGNAIKRVWTAVWNGIKAVLTPIINGIRNIITKVFTAIRVVIVTYVTIWKKIITTAWKAIKTVVTTVVNTIRTVVSTVFNALKNIISVPLNWIKNLVARIFGGIKDSISNSINNAKNIVSKGLAAIRGFFNKLKLKFPNIKLPHFSITGGFSLDPPSVPKLNIDWYAGGAIMRGRQIFGAYGGTLLAGGEPSTGGEAILPLSPFYTALSKMLDNQLQRLITCVRPTVIVHTYLDGKEIGSKVVQQVTDEVTKDQRNYEMAKGLDTDG